MNNAGKNGNASTDGEDPNAETGFFKAACEHSKDVTDIYLNDREMLPRLIGDSREAATRNKHVIRPILEKPEYGRLGQFSSIPPEVVRDLQDWQRQGIIAAVDGTAAVDITTLPNKIVYGVAVGSVTTKRLSKPRITFTETHQNRPTPDNIHDILELQKTLEAAQADQSWPRTYREYFERKEAIRLINDEHCRLALIDGPIYTQNLLTQELGRELLKPILENQSRYIGYIKEPPKFHKELGSALLTGEYWIFDKFKDLLAQERFAQGAAAGNWVRQSKDWVRCLYKLKQKVFEFECDPSMVMHGLALVQLDPSDALHHEIPYLLELVDRYIRAQSRAADLKRNLIASLGTEALTYENEREYRQ